MERYPMFIDKKCDIVIYNRKYTFGLCPLTAPKTLRISEVMRVIKAFCYVNKMAFGKHLRLEAGCHRSQPQD